MKIFVLLFVFIAVCAAGVIENSIWKYKQGDRYFYITDDDGIIHQIDTEDEIDQDFIDNYNDTDNGFQLFTQKNPTTPQMLAIEDDESVINSNFDPEKITVLYSHGWMSSPTGGTSNTSRDAFLEMEDINFIHLDWQEMAGRNYITAKFGVAQVGRALGAFVMWLTTHGLQYEKVHLVGHSLGAHVVGNAGRSVGSRVKRITALDPAGPLYTSGDDERIASTDAQYVEVIHTNTAVLGYGDPLGHADFYPNGGVIMPGCFIDIVCSHRRAPEYMASSVKYNHMVANECRNIQDMQRDRCTGSEYPMGNNDLNKFRTGIFRVNTENDYPYDPKS